MSLPGWHHVVAAEIFLGWHMRVAYIHTRAHVRCSYWDGLCVAEIQKLGGGGGAFGIVGSLGTSRPSSSFKLRREVSAGCCA